MILTNYYYYYKSAFSKDICKKIINKVKENNLIKGQVKNNKLKDTRNSNIFFLNEQWIYDLIWPYLQNANEKSGWSFDIDHAEDLQYTEYSKNQFYNWHADGSSDNFGVYTKKDNVGDALIGKVRKISMTMNLSDEKDYKGGDFEIDFGPYVKNRFQVINEIKTQGSLIFFPSFVNHRITRVISGTRKSLVMWTIGKPFK